MMSTFLPIAVIVLLAIAALFIAYKWGGTKQKLKTSSTANKKLRETDEQVKKHSGSGVSRWRDKLRKRKNN
jgi:flagellar basal body-associated protein FliL